MYLPLNGSLLNLEVLKGSSACNPFLLFHTYPIVSWPAYLLQLCILYFPARRYDIHVCKTNRLCQPVRKICTLTIAMIELMYCMSCTICTTCFSSNICIPTQCLKCFGCLYVTVSVKVEYWYMASVSACFQCCCASHHVLSSNENAEATFAMHKR